MIPRPDASEHLPYYSKYIDRVPDGDLLQTLRTQMDDTLALVRGLDEAQGGHAYAPGKWTIRGVLNHLIDAERIFAYRALRIARGDQTPLESFDENAYAETAGADARTLADLADEMEHVRRANLSLFGSLSDEALARRGTASGGVVSVRALAWIIAGHEVHHVALLRERYLSGEPAAATS
jgi:uncharacterized damage-inducible protein DinB